MIRTANQSLTHILIHCEQHVQVILVIMGLFAFLWNLMRATSHRKKEEQPVAIVLPPLRMVSHSLLDMDANIPRVNLAFLENPIKEVLASA